VGLGAVLLIWLANLPQPLEWALQRGSPAITQSMLYLWLPLSCAVFLLLRVRNAGFSGQIEAVAHTMVKETARTRISLVFIVLLLIILPMLPLALDPTRPLRFRVQNFISSSRDVTFVLASVMTLLLACASVAFEIRDRQIWQLMTKPVMRFNYLLGKWLGIATINLILLCIAGVSTFSFIQYLSRQPVESNMDGAMDAMAVRDEILTARQSGRPEYERYDMSLLRNQIDQELANDPAFVDKVVTTADRNRRALQLIQQFDAGQRSIPPNGGTRVYKFTGLSRAKQTSDTFTLRYRFHIMADDEHQVFNARFLYLGKDDRTVIGHSDRSYVPTMSHSLPLPTDLILDDGTFRIAIQNNFTPPVEDRGFGGLNFEEKDFEVLYKVGSFESNFFRAMLMSWIKLCCLAALGVGCATFLSFPVACLASFTIFAAGAISPFLALALEWYYPVETSQLDWSNVGMVVQWAFESFTRFIAQMLVFLLGSYGEHQPTQQLVEGRLIEWSDVLLRLLKLGVVWCGLSLVVGWAVLRKRQLAIYSGQG
jgi:hypothetical protein